LFARACITLSRAPPHFDARCLLCRLQHLPFSPPNKAPPTHASRQRRTRRRHVKTRFDTVPCTFLHARSRFAAAAAAPFQTPSRPDVAAFCLIIKRAQRSPRRPSPARHDYAAARKRVARRHRRSHAAPRTASAAAPAAQRRRCSQQAAKCMSPQRRRRCCRARRRCAKDSA